MSDIEGLDALLNKLSKLEGIDKSNDAIFAGALVLERGSKERAPVLTGFLRASGLSRKVSGGAEVAFTADYAWEQEMGTSKIPAKGYVRKTIDEDSDQILNAVAEQLKKDLDKLAG